MGPFCEWHLETRQLGQRVLVYEVTDSTSTRCAALADDPGNHGLVVLAHAQTAGRGQHGRSWLCQPGMGVLLSVLLFPPPELRRPALLTAWAAVSVCELIRQATGLPARIKWPNDVLLQGRKVCGILIEQHRGLVVGIGLNLNQEPNTFLADGLTEAGSLHLFTGHRYDGEQVARELIACLDQQYQHLLSGELAPLESRWRDGLDLVGRYVFVEGHTGSYRGYVLDLTFDGVALVADAAEPLLLPPESIRHIRPV